MFRSIKFLTNTVNGIPILLLSNCALEKGSVGKYFKSSLISEQRLLIFKFSAWPEPQSNLFLEIIMRAKHELGKQHENLSHLILAKDFPNISYEFWSVSRFVTKIYCIAFPQKFCRNTISDVHNFSINNGFSKVYSDYYSSIG